MGKHVLTSVVIATVLTLGACSGLKSTLSSVAGQADETSTDVKKAVGKAADKYCLEVPAVARNGIRSQVNQFTDVATIKIECSNDHGGAEASE